MAQRRWRRWGLLALFAVTLTGISSAEEQSPPAVNVTTHGVMTQNEIWRDEIHIIGDIHVLPGVTLTIEAGTHVLIAAHSDTENLQQGAFEMKSGLQMESENQYGVHRGEPYEDQGNHIFLEIEGTLHAVGTPTERITITSDSPNPDRYDWTGIYFAHGELVFTDIEYYRHLDPGEGTVIRNCTLRHTGGCAVCTGAGGDDFVVEGSRIYDSGHELVDLVGTNGVVIRDNVLGPNRPKTNPGGFSNDGVIGIVLIDCAPEIVGNVITECAMGILLINKPEIPLDAYVASLCATNTIEGDYAAIAEATDDEPRILSRCDMVERDGETDEENESEPAEARQDDLL